MKTINQINAAVNNNQTIKINNMLKTTLPLSISTAKEAAKFLRELNANGEAYHPEDDALDCLEGHVTEEQGKQLNKLMADIYSLDCNSDKANLSFDPCGFLLMEDREFKIIDLTGREYHDKCSGNKILEELGEIKPAPTVFNVALLDENKNLIDDTQIDEYNEDLAWSVFTESGHEKKEGYTLEFDEIADTEAEEDAEDIQKRELAEWIQSADDGDEHQTNSTKYIRIS
jgi:hypothetical protein